MLVRECCIVLVVTGAVVLATEPTTDTAAIDIDTRPRGERAEDGDLPPPRRRPRPGSSSSFGSFLSGFLGSVTKTASVDGCPGKCIHALASLMCDSVREDIQCPASNMRCCVENSKKTPRPPPRENVNPLDSLLELELPPKPDDNKIEDKVDKDVDEEEEEEKEEEVTEPVKEKKRRKKKKKNTTEAPTTTTTETTTTKESKENKKSSNSSLSRFNSNSTFSLVFVSLLTFLQTFKKL